MMKSLKFNNKFACMLLLMALIIVVAIAIMPLKSNISYANDTTLEIVFPSNDYIQSSSPSLISANENFLLVYDEDVSSLFVKTLETNVDYKYELNFTSVETILAVNNSAFILADNQIYKLDLLDTNASPVIINLPTPNNISSITTDGTYLYAQSIYGYISAYYDDLAIAFSTDNLLNDIFLGKSLFVGNGNMAYTFTNNYGELYLNFLNLDTQETIETPFNYQVQEASIGNAIYTKIDGQIVVFNKETKVLEANTSIQPDSFIAIGEKLYTIEGKVIYVYQYNSIDKSLSLISSISMSGNDKKHLNNPQSILKLDNSFIIADSNNKRLSYIDDKNNMDILSLESKPTSLCSSQSAIFVLCENGSVLKIVDKQITSTYTLDGIESFTYLDKLYALKNDGIYILLGGKFVKYLTIDNPTYISSNADGNMLYVVSDEKLYVVSKDGKIVNQVSYDFSNIIDFKVDYVGNLYILKDNSVTKINNNMFSLSIGPTYSIPERFSLTPNSFILDGTNIYLTCDECVVVKDLFSSTTIDNIEKVNVDLSNESFYYALKNSASSLAYNQYAISDSIYTLQDDVIEISSKQYNEDYYYAKNKDGIFIVNINDFSKINESTNSSIYKLNEDSNIYKDILGSPSNTLNKDTQITATSQLSILETTYIKFELSGDNYYINLSNLTIVEQHIDEDPTEDVEPEKIYGKAQASRVGKKVNIYSLPSVDSDIIATIKDGEKVEIISEDESFYYVSFDGTLGYIEKDSLIKSGITKIQLIAIILSVVVVVAGFTIFLSYFYYKKKSE